MTDAEVFFLCFMAWLGAIVGFTAANMPEPLPANVVVTIEYR